MTRPSSAPARRFKRSNSDPLPPLHSRHLPPPPRQKQRHSVTSGLRPPPPLSKQTQHKSKRTRFSFPVTSKRSSKVRGYLSSDSEGDGQEDEEWGLLEGRDEESILSEELEIQPYLTPKNKSTHLVKYLLAKTIELLSSDYNSFQTSHSSSLSKSSLLIDKTFLEDSVKMTQDQLAGFQVQCEKNWDGLKRDKEKLVGEETRENQRKALGMVERIQQLSTQILSNRQSTKSQLAQIASETEHSLSKEEETWEKEVDKVSQKLMKFLRGPPPSPPQKRIKPSKSSQSGGGGSNRRRSRKAMTSADESESQSLGRDKERKKRRKTG